MKKLIAALAICVGTSAFANDTTAQDAQRAQQEKKQDTNKVFTQQPGDATREAQREGEKGLDATEVGPKIGKAAKDVTGVQSEDEGTFKVKQAFSMSGTLKDRNLEGVSIERTGLPAADLDVRDKTAVWLDGKKVKVDAIPEGAQVRAKFQIEGQDIVAVELRATSPKGTPKARPMNDGTGGSGTLKDDADKVEKDVKHEANETRDDVNKALK